jgi:hypothetical protein
MMAASRRARGRFGEDSFVVIKKLEDPAVISRIPPAEAAAVQEKQ